MLAKQLKTKQNKKKQKGRFLGVLLDASGASLFGNMLADEGGIATRTGKDVSNTSL